VNGLKALGRLRVMTVNTATGVWSTGRYNFVRVTANNPLLRRSATASSSSRPSLSARPEPRLAPGHTVRPGRTLKPSGYYILPVIQEWLVQLKGIFPKLVIGVDSYCHCAGISAIRASPDQIIDYHIVTLSQPLFDQGMHCSSFFLAYSHT